MNEYDYVVNFHGESNDNRNSYQLVSITKYDGFTEEARAIGNKWFYFL